MDTKKDKSLEISTYVPDQDYERVQKLKQKMNTAMRNQRRVERSGLFLPVNAKMKKFIKFKDLERRIIDAKKANKKLHRHTMIIEGLKTGIIKVVLRKRVELEKDSLPDYLSTEIFIKSFQDIENIKLINNEQE
jgi:hypothetical protein